MCNDIVACVDKAIGNSQHDGMNEADKVRWKDTISDLKSEGYGETARWMEQYGKDGKITNEEASEIRSSLKKEIVTDLFLGLGEDSVNKNRETGTGA